MGVHFSAVTSIGVSVLIRHVSAWPLVTGTVALTGTSPVKAAGTCCWKTGVPARVIRIVRSSVVAALLVSAPPSVRVPSLGTVTVAARPASVKSSAAVLEVSGRPLASEVSGRPV